MQQQTLKDADMHDIKCRKHSCRAQISLNDVPPQSKIFPTRVEARTEAWKLKEDLVRQKERTIKLFYQRLYNCFVMQPELFGCYPIKMLFIGLSIGFSFMNNAVLMIWR